MLAYDAVEWHRLRRLDSVAAVPASIARNLQARPEPQFSQDAPHMTFDRLNTDLQPVPDFLITQTLPNKSDDLSLAPTDPRCSRQVDTTRTKVPYNC